MTALYALAALAALAFIGACIAACKLATSPMAVERPWQPGER